MGSDVVVCRHAVFRRHSRSGVYADPYSQHPNPNADANSDIFENSDADPFADANSDIYTDNVEINDSDPFPDTDSDSYTDVFENNDADTDDDSNPDPE